MSKAYYAHIGRCLREFLCAACALALLSVFTIAIIVGVTTTVAEMDSTSTSPSLKTITVSPPESCDIDRYPLAKSDFYTLNNIPYHDRIDDADSGMRY